MELTRQVLIVDDDEVTCEILGGALEQLGFSVQCVYNGTQAIAALRTGNYSLLVCDWEMPLMDGPQLCQWVRGGPFANSTYIVMLTSRQGLEDSVDGLRNGADAFICKPCDPAAVAHHLRTGAEQLGKGEYRPPDVVPMDLFTPDP